MSNWKSSTGITMLTEAGLEVNHAYYRCMNEAKQIRVMDDTLTGLMKFITDKYNSIDFAEIERSQGDIKRFKYYGMLVENTQTLANIYTASSDPGAAKYVEVINAIKTCLDHLAGRRTEYNTLYKQGNGLVQLMYTSLLAGCIYALGTLVSNTIRFVTIEDETDCQVMFDEIPGSIKNVHIKNIVSAANSMDKFNKIITESSMNRGRVNEVAVGAVVGVIIGGIILLAPAIIYIIREIVYSIYYTRVKLSDMLAVQIDLLNTNIETLESGRGTKAVVVRQKRIVAKLEQWKSRIAVKMDTVDQLKNAQIRKENSTLRVDKNSPVLQAPDSFDTVLI